MATLRRARFIGWIEGMPAVITALEEDCGYSWTNSSMDRKAIAIVVLRILAARGDFFSGNGTPSQRRKAQIEAASCLSCSYVTSRAPCIYRKRLSKKHFFRGYASRKKKKVSSELTPSTNPEPYVTAPARPVPVPARSAQAPRTVAVGTTANGF